MIDIKTMIESSENYCKHLGWTPAPVKDSIKVMKMWRRLKELSSSKDVGVPHWMMRIDAMVETLEEEFFPSLISRTLTVKFTIPPHLAPCDINEIKNVMEKVSSVKVQEATYEKDC